MKRNDFEELDAMMDETIQRKLILIEVAKMPMDLIHLMAKQRTPCMPELDPARWD